MKIIKQLKPFDYFVIFIIIFGLIVGYLTFKGKRMTSSNQIEKTSKIEFQVTLRGVVLTSKTDIFNQNDETFITIRNVPYTKLKIKNVKQERRKTLVAPNGSSKPIVVEDETLPNTYDIVVTLVDEAKITKEGDFVAGGNKIKIGLPITLEGGVYKLNGIISSVSVFGE
ncbi:DUF4330 domain-containing protein [bacterium]|nr:DUF4330 domain-containing protein [bacterium]